MIHNLIHSTGRNRNHQFKKKKKSRWDDGCGLIQAERRKALRGDNRLEIVVCLSAAEWSKNTQRLGKDSPFPLASCAAGPFQTVSMNLFPHNSPHKSLHYDKVDFVWVFYKFIINRKPKTLHYISIHSMFFITLLVMLKIELFPLFIHYVSIP